MEGMRRQDPPPVPQLAVPIAVVSNVFEATYAQKTTNKLRAIADLIIIAFYFLLRVGEYTRPRTTKVNGKEQRATRTQQFQVDNVGFFKNGIVVPRNAPLADLLAADSVTMRITNQKNGRMGQTIHHEAVTHPHCPVKAVARRVHHILSHGGNDNSLLCDFKDDVTNKWGSVTASDIITHVRFAVKRLGLHKAGIDPDMVGAHSLRAGGAMAMKLNGVDTETIMKHGRWTGLTFMMYIHNQIAHLSTDLSAKMSKELPFVNIANF